VSATSKTPAPADVRDAITAYIGALNKALRDPAGSADALSRLIAPNCPCASVLELLNNEARQGRYLDYTYAVSDVAVQQVGALGGSATYLALQSAGHERTLNGKVTDTFPANRARYSVHFRRNGDAWLLDRLDVVAK
jgi:hypothetical protein